MEPNRVELIGRVNHTEIKEHKNCTVAKFAISKQIRENEYKSFWVTIFNDEGVKAYKLLKKGDYAHIKGKLSVSTYVVNEKPIDKLEIIGFEAKKVKYDTDKKLYVEMTEEEIKAEEAKAKEGVEDWG